MNSTIRNPIWLIVFLSGLAIALAVIWVGPIVKHWIIEKAYVVRYRDIGPGSADYAFDMMNGFSFSRASSISHSILGPRRATGMRSESDYWVEPDITQLWWNGRFIVCYQVLSGTTPENARTPGWWIIDTVALSRDGPLDEPALATKCKELALKHIQIWQAFAESGNESLHTRGDQHVASL